jgi:hypothetical protein
VYSAHSIEPQSGRACQSLLACALLFASCQGPALVVERPPAPDQDAICYLDGLRVPPDAKDRARPQRRALPYYGTLALDAVPAIRDVDRDQFARMPARTDAEVVEPVTPWVFPFDFFGEIVVRLFTGVEDARVQAAVAPNPAPAVTGSHLSDSKALRQRALLARIWR